MSTMTIDQMFTAQPVAHPRGALRLTRRGRVVVVLLALLMALAVSVVLAAASTATDESGTPEATRVVLVGPGDTLWDIASTIADDGDVRAAMEHIEDLNALDTAALQSGQRLVVPVD